MAGKDRPALISSQWEWSGVVAGGERPLTCRSCGTFRGTAELPPGPGSPQAAVGWDQAECFACWERGCLRSSLWREEHPGGGKQANS